MKSPKPCLALVAGLAASLTACATTPPRHAAAAALATAHSPGRSAHTRAGCPLGRLLPHGGAIAIDYVDFLRLRPGPRYTRSAATRRAADWRRTGTASYRSTSPRPPCTITPRRRPAHPIERPADTHGHEPPESLSDDRQLRRSLPHPNRNAHLTKLIFPAGVSSVAVSLLAGQDTDNQDQFTLSGIGS